MSRLHGSAIGSTLWMIESWQPALRKWIVDDCTRHSSTAEKTLNCMRRDAPAGVKYRIRRFVAEGETPRGKKPRKAASHGE